MNSLLFALSVLFCCTCMLPGLAGAKPLTGIVANVNVTSDIQHSQAGLPALSSGENTLTFSAGPQEGRLTLEGSTDPANKGKQLVVKVRLLVMPPDLLGQNPGRRRESD